MLALSAVKGPELSRQRPVEAKRNLTAKTVGNTLSAGQGDTPRPDGKPAKSGKERL